jgi:hypothetical protein
MRAKLRNGHQLLPAMDWHHQALQSWRPLLLRHPLQPWELLLHPCRALVLVVRRWAVAVGVQLQI